jgi:phytoene synthase
MPRELAIAPADLAACSAKLRAGSKTFSAAARLLPKRMRAPVTVLYAFCRVADDAIDARPDVTEATVLALRVRLDHVFAGTPDDDPVDRALAVVVRTAALPRAPLDALLDGFAWDAQGRRCETLDDLYAYAARVAGTVGVMMTVLMGARAARTLARACDLGVAMQLTNIARDVGEDAALGRIYLPLAWMRDAGIDPDAWLRNPAHDAALGAVVARVLAHAELLYARAERGIAELPRDCRTAIYAARLLYAAIGGAVARAGYDAVSRRAHVPWWQKALLLVRALGAPLLRRQREVAPPLDATRFLVTACGGETP